MIGYERRAHLNCESELRGPCVLKLSTIHGSELWRLRRGKVSIPRRQGGLLQSCCATGQRLTFGICPGIRRRTDWVLGGELEHRRTPHHTFCVVLRATRMNNFETTLSLDRYSPTAVLLTHPMGHLMKSWWQDSAREWGKGEDCRTLVGQERTGRVKCHAVLPS